MIQKLFHQFVRVDLWTIMITVPFNYKPIKMKLKVHIFIEFTVATVTFCNKEKTINCSLMDWGICLKPLI